MKNLAFGNRITREVNQMAKDVAKIGYQSFDYNRVEFRRRLEEYYAFGKHGSDALAVRLNEMDYYEKRLTDIVLSAFIGALLGFFYNYLEELTQIFANFTENSLILYIMYLVMIFIIVALFTFVITFFIKWFGGATSYQKLHCEEFEKELIEKQLLERELDVLKKGKNKQTCCKQYRQRIKARR